MGGTELYKTLYGRYKIKHKTLYGRYKIILKLSMGGTELSDSAWKVQNYKTLYGRTSIFGETIK